MTAGSARSARRSLLRAGPSAHFWQRRERGDGASRPERPQRLFTRRSQRGLRLRGLSGRVDVSIVDLGYLRLRHFDQLAVRQFLESLDDGLGALVVLDPQ